MNKMTFKSFRYTALAVAAAASLALTSCGAYDESRNAAAPTPAYAAPASALTIDETWAKAIDGGMTSAFGTVRNSTGEDITIVGASTPAAKTAELHEVIAGADGGMKMQPKEGGFVVPANGEIVLEPGNDHIMMMGLVKPVQAGDEISLTLELSTGDTLDFTAVVKDFSGANEDYGDLADDEGMDHGTDTPAGSPTHAK